MANASRVVLHYRSDSSAFNHLVPTGQVVPQMRVEPTTPHPVDRLLPHSHLQQMKRLLELADAPRGQQRERRREAEHLSPVPAQ